MITVLYFGIAQDICGKTEEKLSASGTEELKRIITDKYPELRNISFRIALNSSLRNGNEKLSAGDKVAILPPFAGG